MSFLEFIWEPIRFVLAILESVVVFFGVLFTGGGLVAPGDYYASLNNSGIFANQAQDSLPQTAIYDIVMDHFAEEEAEEAEDGEEAEEGEAETRIPKCLIIGFDGARADALFNTVNEAESGVQLLKKSGGKVYNMVTGGDSLFRLQDTSTAPGWTTALTGKWAKGDGGHGINKNGITKEATPKLLFTELLEQELTTRTSFVVSWDGHFEAETATYKKDIAACEGLEADWITTENDMQTYIKTVEEVQKEDAGVVMCIFEHCDLAGESSGFGNYNDDYAAATKTSDREAYRLIKVVEQRMEENPDEDWLILITSDHGGVFKGHGIQFSACRQVFLASNKKLDLADYA